jgi:GTP cyclohydrolase II
MRVMSAPKRFLGIAGFGLEVVDYIHNWNDNSLVGLKD